MSFGQLYPRSASIHGLLLLPSGLPPSPMVPTVFLMCTFCMYSFCSGRITIHFPFCSLGLSFCSKTHRGPPSQACSSSRMGVPVPEHCFKQMHRGPHVCLNWLAPKQVEISFCASERMGVHSSHHGPVLTNPH